MIKLADCIGMCGLTERSASVAQPIDYMLKRCDRVARFIEDGRVCLTNNAAERAVEQLNQHLD